MATNRTFQRRSLRGFTLIEALVATLIVALALVAVSTRVSLAAKVAKRTQEQTFQRWVAMNAITELRLKPGLPDTGRSDGDEEMAGQNWRWTMDITNAPGIEDLRRVEVEVTREDIDNGTVLKLVALVGETTVGANLRPWSGWPDASGSGGNDDNRNQIPGAPVLPGQRPDPRRGLDRSGSQ